jgi:hypothetical protein
LGINRSNLSDFITYLNEQIGQPYLWGGQHTKLTPENYKTVIHKVEKDSGGYDGLTYEQAVIEFCEKLFKKGQKVLYAYDCSGLGMYWLQNIKKLYKSDMNANGMMSKCELHIDQTPKKGWWVFRLNDKSSRAVHIGYMIDDKYLVEAKGRKYGVVKTKFAKKKWHKWGIPDIFKSQILDSESENHNEDRFVFNRILKYGCRGEDVKQLKQLLYEHGYKSLSRSNPNYLSKTVSVVKQYQKDNGLAVDGKAGPQTIASLGGIYI